MDVPERMLYSTRRGSIIFLEPDGGTAPDHAARMFTPGATTSGFRISGATTLGPRDENPATIGARFSPVTVSQAKANDTTGYGDDDM
jgi:hypothetical protein